MLKAGANTKLGKQGAKGMQKATGDHHIGPSDRASSPEQDKDLQQERTSEAAVWLHGTMSIEILAARGLPRHRVLLSLRRSVVAPANKCMGCAERMICGVRPPKAYVTINLGAATRARSSIIKTSTSPEWNERIIAPVADKVSHIRLTVKDNNQFTAPPIGHARIPVAEIAPGKKFDAWVDLLDDQEEVVSKKDPLRQHSKAQVHVTMTYTPVASDPGWGNGLGTGPDMGALPQTYFPMRHGCRMHLYNDAYQDPAWQPSFKLDNGEYYKARGAWTDLYDAILAAKHLIYITGWSVYRMIHLRREPGVKPQDGKYPSLGEMLIQRANAGVRVCLLVWDDKTSLGAPLMRTEGLMLVHDEDNAKFFDNTKVVVRKAARNAGGKDDSWMYWLQRGSMFTHHQKSVICDTPQAEGAPAKSPVRLIAFMGGLDLCDGRYDDRNHWMFRTLHNEHNLDYHQACIKGAVIEKGGPRQPWHDVHAMVEGPIVWDLMANFTARWRKQAGTLHIRKLRKLHEVQGLQVPERQRGIQNEQRGDPCCFAVEATDREAFCAQLFRSIDSTSAIGLEEQRDNHFSLGLTSGKGRIIECSIQMGYIAAIRRAQRFLYIENQYFLGSSHMWEDHIGAGESTQLVPIEIALKVASQIRAGKEFAAYIMLPMWPEGFPETGAVQEVLFWQTCTLRMMFKIVGDALAEAGVQGKHPGDYLIFLTVGSREPREAGEPEPEQKAPAGNYTAAQEARRFMIYVHSKYMVVDDEYAIVGSANINQRSLDGARDTELAIGHFQPYYTHRTTGGPTVKGQVYGFRATLWEEHWGTWKPCFERPESPECVQEIKNLSRINWEHYVQPEVLKLPGHAMPYPIQVLDNGVVEPLPGHENFPDTQAKVLGAEIGSMPDMLTS